MPTNKGIPQQRLNIYHHNESLLFQFILYEHIRSQKETVVFDRYLTETSSAEESLNQLKESLKILIGMHSGFLCLFSWNRDEGILTKLNNYCALLIRQSVQSEKLTALHTHSEKCWKCCIKLQQTIEDKPYPETLQPIVQKTLTALKKISNVILKTIPHFKNDENVVFFLLRYKKELQTVYGTHVLENLFVKMYAQGTLEAEKFLLLRYSARGFTNLLPTISAKIAELHSPLPL